MMTLEQRILTIALVALGTIAMRFLPNILFPDNKPIPQTVQYLGKVLPFSVIGLLVVYCLKSVSFFTFSYGLPEIISICCIIGLHLWKGNALISIGAGTVIYMLLVQLVFVTP